MLIEQKETRLAWGSLDLALFGIEKDWDGEKLNTPVAFGFAMDGENLWFVATRTDPAMIHPEARPGKFTPELWKYDVAEFFLSHPASGRYLEFNLAPNGAWWSAEFTAPRVCAHEGEDFPVPGVNTYAELSPEGAWMAAASIPLEVLKARFDFGEKTALNATFIVNSPEQRFLTSTRPPSGVEPDFHHPELLKQVQIQKGGLSFQKQYPETKL